MRARLALAVSGETVEIREVLLRDKHPAFVAASESGTVPCLVTGREIIDESLDIMIWALRRNDPEGWLNMPEEGWGLIAQADGPFKVALDRTKYATRYPESDWKVHRQIASDVLSGWNTQITDWFFDGPTLADFAILPFVRQFAFIDKGWFDTQPWPDLQNWLNGFVTSPQFQNTMFKLPPWQSGDDPVFQIRSGLTDIMPDQT